ncbi:50S ribosomal protein L5 [bacterium]|jgi:large subunit ribosomal protein L5|nr:50S ribosomal protein L5 [bacterium]MBT3903750.1 50S ribosomal protein L5 [bacterium]MBT4577953.1 50S ribosomal protein L5 [bacterium]MBT5346103.1 50S ribosomal protein L5 [bacterium]MBT6131372.1 50S ribosomal protein L5 [bacterium]
MSKAAQFFELYTGKIRPELQKQLGISNIMQVPKVDKIVLNIGCKEAVRDSRALKLVRKVLTNIAGQTSVNTYARNSIAGFKLREGMPIGAKVTLRGKQMYVFLEKLISLALPKVRDFRGLNDKIDGRGGYNIGVREWNIFPEAEAAAGEKLYGLNVSINTTAKTDEHTRALLASFGMPFKKKNQDKKRS